MKSFYLKLFSVCEIFSFFFACHSALGLVWAGTRAHSGDWYGSGMLLPGQGLRGRLPLLSPDFRHFNLRRHISTTREILVVKGGTMGREYCPVNLADMTTSTPFRDPLHAAKYDMGPAALLPLRRKACWNFFFAVNIRRLRQGFNTRTLVPVASTLTPRPPKPLCEICIEIFSFSKLCQRPCTVTGLSPFVSSKRMKLFAGCPFVSDTEERTYITQFCDQ